MLKNLDPKDKKGMFHTLRLLITPVREMICGFLGPDSNTLVVKEWFLKQKRENSGYF